jgi:hypothetical protein
MKAFWMGLLVLGLTACTTEQVINRPGGRTEFAIACGASTGWNICYQRVNELCPQGYDTVSEDGGFNRKEMRIACAGPKSR